MTGVCHYAEESEMVWLPFVVIYIPEDSQCRADIRVGQVNALADQPIRGSVMGSAK